MGSLLFPGEFFICLVEAVAVFLLFFFQLDCKKPRLYAALAGIPILALLAFALARLGLPLLLSVLLITLSHLLYALLCFHASLSAKCIWSMVPATVLCVSNYCSMLLFYLLSRGRILSFLGTSGLWILQRLLYILFIAGFLCLIKRVQKVDGELPVFFQLASVALPLIGVNIAMSGVYEGLAMTPGRPDPTVWTLCAVVLLLSVAMMFFSRYLSRLYRRQLEAQKELQKAKLEAEHVSQVEAMYEIVRCWRHDTQGMVSTVLNLADQEKYGEMKQYLREISGAAEETRQIVSTGNPVIDATVSARFMLAEKNGIRVEHTLSLPEALPLDDMDISSILMNLLDNAIEAVRVLPQEKRVIDFSLLDKGGMLQIEIQNPCQGDYRYEDGKLATTKDDPSVHGVGLERVSRLVEKYQGFVKLEPQPDCFKARVLIPMERKVE